MRQAVLKEDAKSKLHQKGGKGDASYKTAKDRLTLLFGGNASGDLKQKPLLVSHSENSRTLKSIAKGSLPGMWFTTQQLARGFSLMLVFEAQDPNVERYRKVTTAVETAIRCYRVNYDEKRSYYTDITGLFLQEGR